MSTEKHPAKIGPSQARRLCFALPLLTLACGNKPVELDANSAIIGSPDPAVLGSVREQVETLTVDEQRLYWIGGTDTSNPGLSGKLHSCDKQQCATSLVTYSDDATDPYGEASAQAGIDVRGGEVYWFGNDLQGQLNLNASQIADPSQRRTLARHVYSVSSVIDGDQLFFTDIAQIYAVPLNADDVTPRVVSALPDGQARILAVHGDYVYFVGNRNMTVAVQRTLKDGTGTVEVLADNEQVNTFTNDYTGEYRTPPPPALGLAVDDSYVYWSENVLVGSIVRCPLSGCSGAPEVVATPVRVPAGLWLDGSSLYFQHESDAYQYAVSRCTLGDCGAPSLLASGINTQNAFAVDDQYLYAATNGPVLDPSKDPTKISLVATIRRFPK
jgi:hypothetical protein